MLRHVALSESLQVSAKFTEINLRIYGPQVVTAAYTLARHPTSKIAKENLEGKLFATYLPLVFHRGRNWSRTNFSDFSRSETRLQASCSSQTYFCTVERKIEFHSRHFSFRWYVAVAYDWRDHSGERRARIKPEPTRETSLHVLATTWSKLILLTQSRQNFLYTDVSANSLSRLLFR